MSIKNVKEAVAELKELTAKKEQDFATPARYFLDYIAENPLMETSGQTWKKENELYKQLLTPVLEHRFGKNVSAITFCLLEIKDMNFVHGTAPLSNGHFMTIYFFEDIQLGMAMLPSRERGMDFYRLTFWTSKKSSDEDAIIPTTMINTLQ